MSSTCGRILYCHCAYAKVVPPATKAAVLDGLVESGIEFDAVPDLCEMAARGDERMREFAAEGRLTIAACYPRAVKWLFASAGAGLSDERVRVLNMRADEPGGILQALVDDATVGSAEAAAPESGV